MFTWAKMFSLFVVVALEIIRTLQRRKDYDAAKLESAAEFIVRADDLVSKAQFASNNIDTSADAILSDPDNRDSKDGNDGGVKSAANGLDRTQTSL